MTGFRTRGRFFERMLARHAEGLFERSEGVNECPKRLTYLCKQSDQRVGRIHQLGFSAENCVHEQGQSCQRSPTWVCPSFTKSSHYFRRVPFNAVKQDWERVARGCRIVNERVQTRLGLGGIQTAQVSLNGRCACFVLNSPCQSRQRKRMKVFSMIEVGLRIIDVAAPILSVSANFR